LSSQEFDYVQSADVFGYWALSVVVRLSEGLEEVSTGLIPRTLGPSDDFTLLNGWICLHGVLD